ncbi:MAG TPA: peptidoglycan DD-metalloendopeptidase family protein [Thermoanaerobaculia bacterium]|nr:peptidoglycan DD-metalloendopeptidase family protein [Thermoanaerobaculia bacterium]
MLAAVACVLALASRQLNDFAASPFPLAPAPSYNSITAGLAPLEPTAAPARAAALPIEGTFRRGETLVSALAGVGLPAGEAFQVAAVLGEHVDVRRIRAGNPYSAWRGADGRIQAVQLTLPGEGRLQALRTADESWTSQWEPFERRLVGRTARGVVHGSLVAAVRAAGASAELAFRMADVLQWDLDFGRDLRSGDRFEVAYDQVELDGRPHGLGPLWALLFENRGARIEAYRFGEEGGYYDGDGRPLEKMFLRSPLQFAHVTSRFNLRRFHPVLKRYRPHYGVDYRASVGTPVRVTASGVVTFTGWDRGGGKVVKVRHPNGYLTAYLHLSRFADGVRPGQRVQQGQVIAYSGNTGLSTAPHLDYRVQVQGRWIDPLTLDNVPAEPIPASQRDQFLAWRDTCREALERGQPLRQKPEPVGSLDSIVVAAGGAPELDPVSGSVTAGR